MVTLPKQIRGKGPRVHSTMSSGLIHMYLYCKVGIVHNYPTKGRWIHTVVVDIIYWDAKRRGIYLALFTEPRFMDWVFPWVLWSWFLSALISNFLANFNSPQCKPWAQCCSNMSNVKWSFSLASKSNFWDLQTLLLESLALLSNLTVCCIISSVLKMSIMKKLPSPPQKNKIIYKWINKQTT